MQTPFTLAREVSEAPEETVFPGSGRFLLKWFALGVGLAIPLCWFGVGGGWLQLALIIVSYFVTISLTSFPVVLFLKWAYRIRATEAGIHGGTIWSTPVYMTFAEMESVEPRSVLGMPYLRVTSFRESCPTLWLPRFLSKPEAFRQYITEHTSSAHPLRKSLESGNTLQKREPLPQSSMEPVTDRYPLRY